VAFVYIHVSDDWDELYAGNDFYTMNDYMLRSETIFVKICALECSCAWHRGG
jgi:hypothetical protein